MKNANKSRNKIFGFVQGKEEFFYDFRNSFKKAAEQAAVFQKKMAEGFVNSEDKMPVCTVNQLKGHSSRPVVGIFGSTSRAKFRVAAKRYKFEGSTMRAAIQGAAIRRIAVVDDLLDIFHDNRSGFNIVFNNLIIIF